MTTLADTAGRQQRRRLTVRGQVQGVGFRPFVYRLADELRLAGFVRNDATGVTIELQGRPEQIEAFGRRLRAELPPLARIDRIVEESIESVAGERAEAAFEIRFSDSAGRPQADVTPDSATCDRCLAELFDPSDRRFGYPFINCTHCGPRYSIVREVPYDRPTTTMAAFEMCPACRAEYDNPADRRFHAQPNACPDCGPQVWLADARGRRIEPAAEAAGRLASRNEPSVREAAVEHSAWVVATAADALRAGRIVAVRGLGGYHLAVRADDDAAVARLRERKGREHKPLAVMVADLARAEELVELSEQSRRLLASTQRPIVLAKRRADAPVAPSVAPGTANLGVMLPYTPLHHLLFRELEAPAPGIPLVMTSGNISDEPIAAGNDEAVAALGAVADLFVMHDREIHRRIDDSVALAVGADVLPLRRARGYVPVGVDLPGELGGCPQGLAVGGELKNAVAAVRHRGGVAQAVLSEHVGDLKDGRVYRHFERVVEHLLQVTHAAPQWIAHDLHPMYLSSTWAARQGLPLIGVQHHHAHVAACLAEHGRVGPAVGLAADGVGFGPDGTIWGGEILVADLVEFRRVGRVRPIGLPGGDAAAVRTARPALAWLFDATEGDVPSRWAARLLPDPIERELTLKQLAEGIHCPASSALGRYFDAAAALCGLADANRFEAQAPIALEAAVEDGWDEELPFDMAARTDLFEIDLRPTALAMVDRLDRGEEAGRLAAAFHNTLAAALAEAAARAADAAGVQTVALSGGVFCNRYLTLRLARLLRQRGLEVLTHREAPANDGGLALGQAAVAAARMCGMRSAVQ